MHLSDVNRSPAAARLAELDARAKTEYVQQLHFAVVHSALGNMDRAFELVELGVGDHNGWIGCPRIGHPDAEWAAATT